MEEINNCSGNIGGNENIDCSGHIDFNENMSTVKSMRGDVNHVFLWLFLYNFIFFIVALFQSAIPDWGLLSIIAIIAGNIMLFLVSLSKKHRIRYSSPHREKMTPIAFIALICILGLAQTINLGLSILWKKIGLQGTDIPFEINSIWIVVYAALAGPIAEELSYRGFGKNGLNRLGVIPSIILSSLAFGLMHGNLSQFIFAVMVGLVMGYYCSKYGLIWTIVIHIFNNFLLATLPTLLPVGISQTAEEVSDVFVYVCAAAAIVIIILKRKTISAFLHNPENRAEKGWMAATLSSVWFWLFCIFYIGTMVLLMVSPAAQAVMAMPSVS